MTEYQQLFYPNTAPDELLEDLAVMRFAHVWVRRPGRGEDSWNPKGKTAMEIENRALSIVHGLWAEGWSDFQRAEILVRAQSRAIFAMGSAEKVGFYKRFHKRHFRLIRGIINRRLSIWLRVKYWVRWNRLKVLGI